MKRLLRLCALLSVLMLVFVVAATAAEGAPESEDPLIKDARWYAADQHVSLDEALQRLKLQGSVGELDAMLTEKESSTFAGLWIQHAPQFRVVVQLTSGDAQTIQRYLQSGPLAGLVEVRTAAVSLAQLKAYQAAALQAFRKIGMPADSGINVFQNRVEVYVADAARSYTTLQDATQYLPAHVDLITVPRLAAPAANIYAGLGLTDCTSGFSVVNIMTGFKGISTAAHCSNTQSYNGTNLPFVTQSEYGSDDVQWHTTGSYTPINYAEDGVGGRSITSITPRGSQGLNSFVCKFGKTTGRTCGYIVDKNMTLSYIPNSNPTFIRVHATGVNQASPGDSGGPWFYGASAYGITSGTITYSGQTEVDAAYMAVDYFYDIGIYILTR